MKAHALKRVNLLSKRPRSPDLAGVFFDTDNMSLLWLYFLSLDISRDEETGKIE
jgi:hypothetical protein